MTSLPLRVTLTGFLVFTAIGELSGLLMEGLHTGFSPTGIAKYYRGAEAELMFPKEFWVLLENAHFHVFIVPLVLLVLTHVLFMTRLSDRAKVGITLVAYAAALLELVSPWLVRYGAAGFAWLKLFGDLVFHSTMILLIVVPFYEAWFAPVQKPSDL
jgi:hypothetical protein